MLDYKSLSTDELRQVLASAGAELLSRRHVDMDHASKQNLYRITMPRTPKAEPKAFRYTHFEGDVIRIPLLLDQVFGETGRLIGGKFLLDDGDVVQRVYASGMTLYVVAWQGNLDRQDYEVSKVLQGQTEAETTAKIERFVLGDRTLLIEELTKAIALRREQVAEYDEMGKTDHYWKQLAERDHERLSILEAMLEWAQSTSSPTLVDGTKPSSSATLQ